MKRLIYLIIISVLVASIDSLGQDPFFTHFTNSESNFNPALTGYRGAFTIMTKYKSQWNIDNANGFHSASVLLEESLPCSIFDYGFQASFDQEGDGLLKTLDLGFRLAGTAAWEIGNSTHNLRSGLAFQWANKRIDYNRLLFSDELDPKYGTVDVSGVDLESEFIPPNDGRSLWFVKPAIGLTHRILFNRNARTSPTLHYGISIHNAFTLGDKEYTGNVESILDQDTRIAPRYNFFAMSEFIVMSNSRSFFSVRPLFVWQKQSRLSYYEFGNRFSLNRSVSLGIYYHFNIHNEFNKGSNTNWLTFQTEFGGLISNGRRLDFGFTYAANLTGLQNYLGPIFEISIGMHFASSPSCKMVGLNDEVPYGDHIKCPTSAFTPGRRKMYEGIWYRTIK